MRNHIVGILFLVMAACGGPRVGSVCNQNGDCGGGGLTCYTQLPQGYCTTTCPVPGQTTGCPDGICGLISAVPTPICLRICTNQLDCRINYGCNGITGSNVKACQP